MLKSLWNGVNGVKTQNLGVDITANNISNVNTIGFKRTSSEFADIFYQRVVSRSANPAEIGSGSLLSASKVVYEQGSFTDGEGEFDVGLMGKGFFGVRGFSQTYYTRNGEFTRDGNNYLVDASGNFVLGTVNPNLVPTQFSDRVAQAMGRLNGTNDLVTSGFTVNNPNQDFTIAPSTMQTKLFVPSKNMYYFPEVTTQATFKGTISAVLNTATHEITIDNDKKFSLTNLNATDGFDMASASVTSITQVGERSTYEDKAFGVRVYNLDGSVSSLKYNLHLTNTNRTEKDDFIYEVVAGVYDDNGALIGSESRGQITFNQHGALISNTLTSVPNPQGGTININFGTPTNGNQPSTDRTGAGWDGVYILPGSKSDAITASGNGVAEGFFNRYQIEQDGSIVVQFTNGKTVTVGKLALYTFINEQGLAVVGGNNFMETSNSGAASFLYDNEGKLVRPALFVGQKLEMSNTDLSTELTNLIVMQRGFEASSKSITTSDSMLQTAIGLKK